MQAPARLENDPEFYPTHPHPTTTISNYFSNISQIYEVMPPSFP